MKVSAAALDLGHGHRLRWHTNRDAQGRPFAATVEHDRDGEVCRGGILTVNAPTSYTQFRRADGSTGQHPTWQVQSWEPLTLDPSLLCHCGDHGHIRDGRWVPA